MTNEAFEMLNESFKNNQNPTGKKKIVIHNWKFLF